MHVGFLFNHYAAHQVPHAVPYAFELSLLHQDWQITIACSSNEELKAAKAISTLFPGHRCSFKRLKTKWYHSLQALYFSGTSFKRKKWILRDNVDFFESLDALVAPERNCLNLKALPHLNGLKMIHTRHGAGDAAGAFDERCKAFDFVMLPGQKYADRLSSHGFLNAQQYAIVGYPKFEAVKALQNKKTNFFDNDNPVVVYNPHFDHRISSWQSTGLKVLDFFVENSDYNLIFAPHVVLFKRAKRHGASLPRHYARRPNIFIDKGSAASVDMTYIMAADIYLGDVSSQVYEFLARPRPCIFLNSHKVSWENDLNYNNWALGQVVDDLDTGLRHALDHATSCQTIFAERQRKAFINTFHTEPERDRKSVV